MRPISKPLGTNKINKCALCDKKGFLVKQELVIGNKQFNIENNVFRYYLCKWHIKIRNKQSDENNQLVELTFIDDELILKKN